MMKQCFNIAAGCLVFLLLLGTASSCTREEGPRTWRVSINAGPDAGTRAVSVGGNDGQTLYTNWDNGDLVRVVRGGTKLEQLSADVSEGNSAYAKLTGTLTGSFSVGDALSLYYHEGDLDYTGQNGTVNSVSASYCFMEAVSNVTEVDTGGGFLKLSDAAFSHRQAYFQLRFTDNNNAPVQLEGLSVYADGGKLVKSKPLGGAATYASSGEPLSITTVNSTDQLFFALRDENGTSNTYHFKALIGGTEYSFSRDMNPVWGHFYVGLVQISEVGAEGVLSEVSDYSSGGTLNW